MDAPDEMVEAVAEAIWEHDGPFLLWRQLTEPVKEMSRERARAVLSVPALAEVIARAGELDALAAAGAADIRFWRWESGDGWCVEFDCRPSLLGEGVTPLEALGDLARQTREADQ